MIALIVLAGFAADSRAAEPGTHSPQLTIMRAGERATIPGPAANFTGKVVIDRQVRPDESARIMGSLVSFEPGAHTAWHMHPLGQTLIVTSGCGWVQAEGGKMQEILPGDVIWTPANVRHWHGAQAHSAMSHYAIVEPLNGKSAEWMEHVTKEQYGTEQGRRCKQPTTQLQIQEQGSFLVGGKMITNPGKFDPYKPTPDGQTYRGDHAYVFYQVPVNARKHPLILWHGFGQFSKTWETTPDGREGYQNIFLRRALRRLRPRSAASRRCRSQHGRGDDQADSRRADSGSVRFASASGPTTFPACSSRSDPQALDQYFRQMTPNIGPFDLEVVTDARCQLLERRGPAILVTHSQAGGPGWVTAIKSPNVRGIVAYEPGSNFVFAGRRGATSAAEFEWRGGSVRDVPLRISRSSRRFRSSSTTATTFRRSPTPIRAGRLAGDDSPWRACGAMP